MIARFVGRWRLRIPESALTIFLLTTLFSCTASGAWDAISESLATPGESESVDTGDPEEPEPITVDELGGADFTTIQAALDVAAPGDTIAVAPGSYGNEGSAGDPIVIDVADVTIRGAFSGTSGHAPVRAGNGIVDDSGRRTGAAYVVSTSDETEINDPVRITASGVTLDGLTFDVTGIFGFSADVELMGGDEAVDFGSGTTLRNSRFIETVGGDSGAASQGELATTSPAIEDLVIDNNAVFGVAPGMQIGAADFLGSIKITANVIVNGSLNLTVGPASSAKITIAGNVVSGAYPIGLNGTGFAADEVPPEVIEGLNDVAVENELFGGTFTLAASESDDDLTRFASSLPDFFYGDEGNDTISGGGGNDVLYGGGGDDKLDGGTGDDELSGDGNFASQTGVPGADTLFGGPGDDALRGGPGNDVLDGGPGIDVAEFSAEAAEYNVSVDQNGTPGDTSDDITTVEHTAGGIDGIDTLTNIESLFWDAY